MNLKMMRRMGAFLLSLTMAFTLVTVPAAAADAYTVELNHASLSLTEGDAPVALSATAKSGQTPVFEGKGEQTGLVWTSSNAAVATVSQSGSVEAKGAGTATITATYTDPADNTKTGSATCAVTVSAPVPITGLRINRTEQDLEVDATTELIVTVSPQDATEKLVWTVETASSEGVVTLAAEGNRCVVTAKKPGTARVKAATASGGHPVTCEIEVSGITLEPTTLNLLVGETESLTAFTYGSAPGYDTIVWSSTNISVAEIIDGRITGHYPGTAVITATAGTYKATCTVTVKEDVADAVNASVSAGAALSLSDLVSTLSSRSQDKTESSLSYVSSLQVSPEQGVLYYGYVSSDSPGDGVGGENYYVSPSTGQLDLNELSFVANSNFSGTAVIYYTGRGTNGRSFNGTIRVSVAAAQDVYYSATSDRPVYFQPEDFEAVCRAKTGKDILSITFVPPSSQKGVLHYNYSASNVYNPEVSTGLAFYRTRAPYLGDVVFVPEPNYSGTVEISYRCTTASGTHSGTVTIQVTRVEQTGDGQISYDVTAGGGITLDVDDFNQVSRDLTGSSLNYVYFNLPHSSEGTLYYNYNSATGQGGRVSETTRYFRSGTPRLSYVSFVAADSCSGNVAISFTGYSINGERFSGEVVIRVDQTGGVISYHSSYGEVIQFNGADFNELCQRMNGRALNYVSFEQPASSRGTLYRGTTYNSNTKVSNTTKFYRSGSSYEIDDVVFVPNSSYTGTFDLAFSGYDTSGSRIGGVVQITVERLGQVPVISYQTMSGGLATFQATHFDLACQQLTGERLNYVRFQLPASNQGTLYYNYSNSSGSGTSVYTTTNYYRASASRMLDDVSFRAADQYTGTLSIQYTGVSTSGKQYTGTVEIKVSQPTGSVVNYTGSALPIHLKAADFESACAQMLGKTLSYIRFTQLPGAAAGRLYLNYATPMQTGQAVEQGANYYVSATPSIGQIVFVPRAGYEGYVSIPYTGVDTAGKTFNGTLSLHISNRYGVTSFTDLGSYETAKPSVEFLYHYGAVAGYGNGTFGPERSISRGEFAVMIYRAFELKASGSRYSFSDVPANSFYAEAVAAAKALGIVAGDGERYMPLDTISRQDAMTIVLRAMEVTGKTVPGVSTSVLSSYSDGGQVSSYARAPVSIFVYLGALEGIQTGWLRPHAALTRADMAVLLHHVLTQ